ASDQCRLVRQSHARLQWFHHKTKLPSRANGFMMQPRKRVICQVRQAHEGIDTMVKRTSFEGDGCPIARSLEAIGDWWSLLIIREALFGLRRFGEFQTKLG